MKGHIFDRDDGLTQEFTLSKFEKQKQNSSLPKKLTAGSQVTVNPANKKKHMENKVLPQSPPAKPLELTTSSFSKKCHKSNREH